MSFPSHSEQYKHLSYRGRGVNLDNLTSDEIVEIYSRHVEKINVVWLEDESGERTLGEAVKIWLERKLQADPNYDWTKDPGDPMPPPTGLPLTPESKRAV